ncbi:MAG TPA: hypothetical protein PK196_07010 [Methanoculleus sp.]|nr:hypothetical protein [Methanoculleus sp.]
MFEYGYTRDNPSLPRINLSLIMDRDTGDVSTTPAFRTGSYPCSAVMKSS